MTCNFSCFIETEGLFKVTGSYISYRIYHIISYHTTLAMAPIDVKYGSARHIWRICAMFALMNDCTQQAMEILLSAIVHQSNISTHSLYTIRFSTGNQTNAGFVRGA